MNVHCQTVNEEWPESVRGLHLQFRHELVVDFVDIGCCREKDSLASQRLLLRESREMMMQVNVYHMYSSIAKTQ